MSVLQRTFTDLTFSKSHQVKPANAAESTTGIQNELHGKLRCESARFQSRLKASLAPRCRGEYGPALDGVDGRLGSGNH